MSYNPAEIEPKWRKIWAEKKLYATPEAGGDPANKFYSLYSYPYPSGSGLHVGHVEGMVANDIMARFNRMQGKKVIFPMGWDSFGLPAENYAIKTGVHPQQTTDEAVITFKEQIDRAGISVDWETEVGAHWPEYYKWTQWIFLKMYKKGLAYKKKAPVNWCPQDQTVLANEQVLTDGTCERCGTQVVQKDLEQWFFKITDFAERLHQDLDKVDWPAGTKLQQRNWIGKSAGAEIIWELKNPETLESFNIHTFTTRFDTIPGPTFLVVAPEYPQLDKMVTQPNQEAVADYVEQTKNKTDLERQTDKQKTGVFTGSYAVNPYNGEEVPIYVADYVLVNYGTGAVMGMPGHDLRDFEFAKVFNLPVKHTMKPKDKDLEEGKPYEGEGYQINSGEFDGLWWSDARDKILAKLTAEGRAIPKVNYRIRDWLLSRQRYWGCPIPIVYDPEGNPHAMDEKDLPLLLPTDVDFLPTGESPITGSESFKKLAEEKYGKGWRFEVDTMDTFVDSSWYFFRHTDAKNADAVFDPEKTNFWLPTDLYMIGAEHIVLHLLYARFFTKFLFDEGYIKFDEPFQKMRHMGVILGPDGRKMSKRWGNVINPNDQVEKYGADTLRIYEMFMGPLEQDKAWNDSATAGVRRFLNRVWDFGINKFDVLDKPEKLSASTHRLGLKVTKDIQDLSFNTSIAEFMKTMNEMEANPEKYTQQDWIAILKLLAPFAPHITEELWQMYGGLDSIHLQSWPTFDPTQALENEVQMVIQINGKVRDTLTVARGLNQEEIEKLAQNSGAAKYLEGAEIVKAIYVPEKLINFVIK